VLEKVVSSSADESRSLIAISLGNEVLRRYKGLVALELVIFIIGEGVNGVRELPATGELGGECVPVDFTRRIGGVGASAVEAGLSM
jgi:hypothetical protein